MDSRVAPLREGLRELAQQPPPALPDDDDWQKPKKTCRQIWLAIAVVITGCANTIAKQVSSKPLMRYTYMLSLAAAVAQVPVYACILLCLISTGAVQNYQLKFLWSWPRGQSFPFVMYLVITALGDMLGDGIGMICTPYVAGPVHTLLTNCTAIFAMFLSMCLLGKRYSLLQCGGLSGVFTAVVLGVLPSFLHKSANHPHDNSTDAGFAVVLGFSCIGNASSFVLKELLFKKYDAWRDAEASVGPEGLHAIVVNFHSALFQLPLAFLLVPLNQALGQTNGKDSMTYLKEAFTCLFSSEPGSCGHESVHQEMALACVIVFVACNIMWYICIILSVQTSGAVVTFIALKAVFPICTILFAYVAWPLMGVTPVSFLVWVSVLLMVPAIVVYNWASNLQEGRAKDIPSQATCCWPLGARHHHPELE